MICTSENFVIINSNKDRYTIAVVDNGVVVDHLPRKISLVCSLWIKRGGIIKC